MVIFIQTQMFPREKVTMMSFLVLKDGIWSLLWILVRTYASLLPCPTIEAADLVTCFTQRSGARVLIEYFGTLKGVSKIPLNCSLVILQATKPRWASQCLCHTCHTVSVTHLFSKPQLWSYRQHTRDWITYYYSNCNATVIAWYI